MRTQDFDFELPDRLIAQHPAARRDESRLMVVNRETQSITHHVFRDIGQFFDKNTLLVANNTQVFNARLKGRKETGAAIELFLLDQISAHEWMCLAKPSKRLHVGNKVLFSPDFSATVIEKGQHLRMAFSFSGNFFDCLDQHGQVPLPPYISVNNPKEFLDRYQTVYASERGSVAAPTAGLHFTDDLLNSLQATGVGVEHITLHVGYGTFKPIDADSLHDHRMHSERYKIEHNVAKRIASARQSGKSIIAIGSTTTRTLESAIQADGSLKTGNQHSDLFISPGYNFTCIHGMVTNFHLPKSSLLVMVSAFSGIELIRRAYREAIERDYRFYSFGDAMLLL